MTNPMVGSSAKMEQSSEKFTGEVFWCCRGLTTTKDSRAFWDDDFDSRNKTTIKWFAGIKNMTKP